MSGIKLKIEQLFKASLPVVGTRQYDSSEKARHTIENWNYIKNFPGAQVVSFTMDHLMEIQCQKTIVCEKTDGVRFWLVELMLGHN